jgi:hypothetical protein
MGEDEDQSKPQDEGRPENLAKSEAPKAAANCVADALQHASGKPTWQQRWGLRAAWCATVFGLIGLIAVPSKWVLSEREAARVLNLDMLAINLPRPTFTEARTRVTTQAPAGASEVPAENKAAPDLRMQGSAPALPVATSGPIISQKSARETVHAKPSASDSKIGKTLPRKAAAIRKALKKEKAPGPALAKSQSKRRLAARAGPRSKLHVTPVSRARAQRLAAASKQNRTVSGKKARQCGTGTSRGRMNCDRVRNR